MQLTFRKERKFLIKLRILLKKVAEEFGKIPTKAVTLGRLDLFEIDDNSPLVNRK